MEQSGVALARGRTLTSAWIETFYWLALGEDAGVALSRVRGLKQGSVGDKPGKDLSHSHECVD